MEEHGIATNLSHTKAKHGQTGSCMVFVTPDAERSMCTFLGATAELEASALHPKDIARSKIYYMEGYLAASPSGLAAAIQGRNLARSHGIELALTLSDVSMIRYCRPSLEAMIGDGIDYLFCNEEEAQTWTGFANFEQVQAAIKGIAKVVCITRGAKGCVILTQHHLIEVPSLPVIPVDTNGAGDMFAGAFLYATTHGYDFQQAATLGNMAAATVVGQHGNRLTNQKIASIKQAFLKKLQLTH